MRAPIEPAPPAAPVTEPAPPADPGVRRHEAGLAAMVATAPAWAIGSFLRRKRVVHPNGGLYRATIEITHPLPLLEGTALGRPDRLRALARFSHGFGFGPGRADSRGLALRIFDAGGVGRWDNQEHKHSGLKFVTPDQRHSGRDATILAGREQVYRDARNRNPGRWSRDTRNWKLEDQVWLNPERIRPETLKQAA